MFHFQACAWLGWFAEWCSLGCGVRLKNALQGFEVPFGVREVLWLVVVLWGWLEVIESVSAYGITKHEMVL